uniref:Uncharacterized protein n=1 Tax=Setaria viridis TaxID=4556 RepID=A0A4U6WH62_SETVI|nr:hypothetical protein SEVIR_1G037725v2 [Setaria viridis]
MSLRSGAIRILALICFWMAILSGNGSLAAARDGLGAFCESPNIRIGANRQGEKIVV